MNTQPFPDQTQLLASLRQMAEQTDNPMKKMLVQMALQKAENAHNEKESYLGNRGGHSRHSPEKMQRDIQTLLQINQQMRDAYRSLQEEYQLHRSWNQKASRSLGACECWGQNTQCPNCLGKGIPGVFEADVDGFQHLMQPFIARIIEATIQASETPSTD